MGNIFFTLVIYPLTQIIELVYTFCDKLFTNTGISIIGVSLAVSMLTLPLYVVSEHWQQVERDIQAKMKPMVDRIKSVFKGNEQYMILSTYYAENHYHPIMSLRSAFGLLIQIPFFTAAYSCLSNMSALQGESFLFINDMGAPDALFTIAGFQINVLPIAMTLINCVAGAIYTKGLSFRDKVQVYGLALLFVVILYNSPAGLVLYWTMNNVFSLVKNVFYKLKHPVKTLYYIFCALVSVLIIWLLLFQPISLKRGLLISLVFSLIYFSPLYIRLFNYFSENILGNLIKSNKRRFILFSISSLGLTFLLGLVIPTLLISSSPMEFSGIDSYDSPMFFVWNTFFQAAGFCIIWPFLIYFLYKERIQAFMAFLFTGLLFTCIANAFFFQGDYGTLSKLLIFDSISSVDSPIYLSVINILVIALVFALLLFVLKIKKNKLLASITQLLVFGLLGLSLVNFSKINSGYKEYLEVQEASSNNSSLEPIFTLSKTGKNVLVIYIDRAENQFVPIIFNESPDLYEKYSGFTLYENTVSFNGHTLIGAPACYGGYEYSPESINTRKNESLVKKQNEALLLLPRIFTEEASFNATVTDPSWANYSWVPDLSIYKDYPLIKAYNTEQKYVEHWYRDHKETANIEVTSKKLKRNILWYAFFKTSPVLLRPAFYNNGNYWSTDTQTNDLNDVIKSYSVLEYLPKLTQFTDDSRGTFTNLVNNLTHEDILMQAPDYVPQAEVTNIGTSPHKTAGAYHTNAAALKRIGEWFDFLKANGVYDNTRIIIVSDHGRYPIEDGYKWDEKFEKIEPGHYHPILMMKDFGGTGSLTINRDFMTNADVPSLALSGIVENPTNPFTGKPVNSEDKKRGALVCTSNIFMPYHSKSSNIFTAAKDEWWRVKDNIFDSSNWTLEEHDFTK